MAKICYNTNIMSRNPTRETVVKTLLVNDGDEVLYLQRADDSEKSGTDLPGGKADYESIAQGRQVAADKVREETGIEIPRGGVRFIMQIRRRQKDEQGNAKTVVKTIYQASVDGAPDIELDDTHQSAEWRNFPPNDLKSDYRVALARIGLAQSNK